MKCACKVLLKTASSSLKKEERLDVSKPSSVYPMAPHHSNRPELLKAVCPLDSPREFQKLLIPRPHPRTSDIRLSQCGNTGSSENSLGGSNVRPGLRTRVMEERFVLGDDRRAG